MKLTAAIKYYLNDFKRSVIVFYGVLLLIFVALMITIAYIGTNNVSMSGMESASMIFLFVVGLNSFKNPFRMFLQTGISRKTLFVGFVASLAILSVVMTFLDLGMSWLYGSSMRHESLFFSSFGVRYGTHGAAFLDGLLWSFISYMAAGMAGYFLTTLYYRMNKATKVAVSVGVPILFLTVLPIIDNLYFGGVIYRFFGDIIALANGYPSLKVMVSGALAQGALANPYYSVLFYGAVYLLTGAFGLLLTRSAIAKE
jgi:hypothetical protein